jgi:hypothetical protein
VKAWFISLFHALMPSLDPERAQWRAEMQRQYEQAKHQNRIERVYLATHREPKHRD